MTRFIVEGLDGVGKSLVARYLSKSLGLEYIKIKKEVQVSGLEEEVTQGIVNEISSKLGDDWSGVLDRGFYSAVGTGLCFDASLNPYRLYVPRNLKDARYVFVMSSVPVILGRCGRDLTLQDRRVLESGLFDYAQDWMRDNVPEGGLVVRNDYSDVGGLLRELDDLFVSSK